MNYSKWITHHTEACVTVMAVNREEPHILLCMPVGIFPNQKQARNSFIAVGAVSYDISLHACDI